MLLQIETDVCSVLLAPQLITQASLRFCANRHTIANIVTVEFKTPGQLLAALMEERGWSNRVLAVVLDQEESGISKLIAGKKSFTPEISLSLEEVFEVPAEKFISLQRDFDLASARLISRPNPKRVIRAHLFGGLPVAEMIKRGWLNVDDVRDMPAVEKSVSDFFGVSSIEEIEIMPHAAKRTVISDDATPIQLAWLYRVKKIASEMLVGKFSKTSALRAIDELKELLRSAEEIRKVPRILAECGIRFVIVEALPSSKMDGVCFWLDEKSPVIALTMRFDRIDNFWFVLRHELEHVIQEHGKSKIVFDALDGEKSGLGDSIPEEERMANLAASEFCVPKKSLDSFIARKSPIFQDRDIQGFASTLKIHPGLVAGQLRFKTGQYNRFNSHLVKVRSIVTASAVHDGWGYVAPTGVY